MSKEMSTSNISKVLIGFLYYSLFRYIFCLRFCGCPSVFQRALDMSYSIVPYRIVTRTYHAADRKDILVQDSRDSLALVDIRDTTINDRYC